MRHMQRRDFLKWSGAAAGSALAASAAQAFQTTAAPKPNIVFILCDDLGFGDVGAFYQNQRAAMKERSVPSFSTPHIDTLARDGVKLMQHYSGAPVCAPSRASLLTGLTQGHATVRDNQFDKALDDSHTLGTVLKTSRVRHRRHRQMGFARRRLAEPEEQESSAGRLALQQVR